MNYLYLLTQSTNTGYDTYDSCVVCAPDADTARTIQPNGASRADVWQAWGRSWAYSDDEVKVTLIGVADPSVEQGVVLASYNAG